GVADAPLAAPRHDVRARAGAAACAAVVHVLVGARASSGRGRAGGAAGRAGGAAGRAGGAAGRAGGAGRGGGGAGGRAGVGAGRAGGGGAGRAGAGGAPRAGARHHAAHTPGARPVLVAGQGEFAVVRGAVARRGRERGGGEQRGDDGDLGGESHGGLRQKVPR